MSKYPFSSLQSLKTAQKGQVMSYTYKTWEDYFTFDAAPNERERELALETLSALAALCVLPKKVLRNGPALVCWWESGDKVVVKCSNEEFDAEKGLAMAVLRHLGVKRSWVKKAISGIEEQEG